MWFLCFRTSRVHEPRILFRIYAHWIVMCLLLNSFTVKIFCFFIFPTNCSGLCVQVHREKMRENVKHTHTQCICYIASHLDMILLRRSIQIRIRIWIWIWARDKPIHYYSFILIETGSTSRAHALLKSTNRIHTHTHRVLNAEWKQKFAIFEAIFQTSFIQMQIDGLRSSNKHTIGAHFDFWSSFPAASKQNTAYGFGDFVVRI